MFYVYIYFDPRSKSSFKYGNLEFEYEPFYVGKGKGDRMFVHLKQTGRCNKVNKINSIRKSGLEPLIIKYKEGLDEDKAFELEIELIKRIGRKCLKEGPLTNLHDGGFFGSASGEKNSFFGKHHSDETKKVMSEKVKQWCLENSEKKSKCGKKSHLTAIQNGTVDRKTKGLLKEQNEITKQKIGLANSLKQKGEGNSQFGSMWITNGIEAKKVNKDSEIPQGWIKGRS